MKYHARLDKERLDRFNIGSLKTLKSELEQRPELKKRLEEDFRGTIEAEGIVIDDAFKQEIREQWRSMIQEDVRKIMDKQPKDKKPLYTMVRKGKPLKLNVKIDPVTRKRIITPEVKK